MNKTKSIFIVFLFLLASSNVLAREQADQGQTSFDKASESVQQKLEQSIVELNELREQIAEEKVPLNRQLNDLEAELSNVRREYEQASRLLDTRTLDLSNLRSEIKKRREESSYLSNLLSEYIRNFESRLHISEIQRYHELLEDAKLATENSNLSQQKIYQAQAEVVRSSLKRLFEALGGMRFEGTAVDSTGLVKPGTFVIVGPSALFHSADGKSVGTVQQKLGSLKPAVIPFGDPADANAAAKVIARSEGYLPLDPTLGNAHKIEQTQETILGHIKKGGPVMYPIFGLAGAALLVALFKWFGMVIIRMPSGKKINSLLESVAIKDEKSALEKAKKMKGPVGKMLTAGIEHIKEPRELIEEVMYEKVLATRLKLERFLPFIAITAASAPLLGLLGTVTGIINTFKLITVFGSGDVKTLSGGISEALITTEFGLIVAIPSLLLHAFLSRKAKGVVNQMEKTAVALVNQVSKTPYRQNKTENIDKCSNSYGDNIHEFTAPQSSKGISPACRYPADLAGGIMDSRMISLAKTATVADAVDQIRKSEINNNIESVFVVDEEGKYVGHVHINQLLRQPDTASMASLAQSIMPSVNVDTHRDEVQNLLKRHDFLSMPVVDHDNKLVGQVTRNGKGDREERTK